MLSVVFVCFFLVVVVNNIVSCILFLVYFSIGVLVCTFTTTLLHILVHVHA